MGTPCVNVPGLADATGLPLGVQVIGRFGADRATLEAALFVESALARRKLSATFRVALCRLHLPKYMRACVRRMRGDISCTAYGKFHVSIPAAYGTSGAESDTVRRCSMFVTSGRSRESARLRASSTEEADRWTCLTTECAGGLRGDRFRRRSPVGCVLKSGISP